MTRWDVITMVLRAHRSVLILAVTGASVAVLFLWGSVATRFPTLTATDSAPTPLWVYAPAFPAIVLAASVRSSPDNPAEIATRRVLRATLSFTAAATLLLALLSAAPLLAAGEPTGAITTARNLLFWTGTALLSQRFFGPTVAWALPVALVFPLEWFGNVSRPPAAWAIPLLEPDNTASWIVSVALILTGTASTTASRWHTRSVTRLLRRAYTRRQNTVR